jgi:hypothetical protein
VLKGYNWFVNSVISAATVMYHFPMGMLQIVFMFPLILNVVPIFGWRKEDKIGLGAKISQLTIFSAILAGTIVINLGTIILDENF